MNTLVPAQVADRYRRARTVVFSSGCVAGSAWLVDPRRSYDWFGPPTVGVEEMIDAQAEWVRRGGETLGKPTHFEVRDGNF